MSRRHWTDEEIAFLCANYGTGRLSAQDIADALGRTVRSVHQAADVRGLNRKQPRWTFADIQALRGLNENGWPDARIALELGRDRHAIGKQRRRMGLPSNARGEMVIQAIREGVKRQCKRLGIERVTELRTLAFRKFAIESGWPDDLRPREVQILNALAARGVPMTRLELAQAIGMRTDREDRPGHLALLTGNGPGGTYTANLMRRGLIAKIPRGAVVHGQGKGRSCDLYYLAADALAILEERASWQQRMAGSA